MRAPLLYDHLARRAAAHGGREFLVLGADRRSYELALTQVRRLSATLIRLGVQPGQRVAVFSDPQPDFVVAFLGIAAIGATYLGLNPAYKVAELAYQLADAQPVLALDLLGREDSGLRARVAQAIAEAAPGTQLITLDDDLATWCGSQPIDDGALQGVIARVGPRDAAALVYTSGSTGKPKGALIPQGGLAHCAAIQAEHIFAEEDAAPRCFLNLPVNHIAALGDVIATAIVAGATLVFQRKFDARENLRLVAEERITCWGAIPAMFLMILAEPAFATADLSSVRTAVWGGGAAPLHLVRTLCARVPHLVNIYGLTETVGNVTFGHESDGDASLAETIGRAEARYEVAILDEHGAPVANGCPGEICVRGDFVMLGYLNRPDATAETIDSQGWLHTGDIAERDADGFYRLIGRAKEMFKSGGYNIYPREIELVLEAHPGVALAAIVDIEDRVFGRVGHAFVIADPINVSTDSLTRHCREALANYKVPKRFSILKSLPLLPVGKVDKVTLRRQLANGELS